MENLTIAQKKAILKALQAGECTQADIGPAKYIKAFEDDGSDFVTIEDEIISIEAFEALRDECRQANEIRRHLGLNLHSLVLVKFENYNTKS